VSFRGRVWLAYVVFLVALVGLLFVLPARAANVYCSDVAWHMVWTGNNAGYSENFSWGTSPQSGLSAYLSPYELTVGSWAEGASSISVVAFSGGQPTAWTYTLTQPGCEWTPSPVSNDVPLRYDASNVGAWILVSASVVCFSIGFLGGKQR
jgi:hypothetical protein